MIHTTFLRNPDKTANMKLSSILVVLMGTAVGVNATCLEDCRRICRCDAPGGGSGDCLFSCLGWTCPQYVSPLRDLLGLFPRH